MGLWSSQSLSVPNGRFKETGERTRAEAQASACILEFLKNVFAFSASSLITHYCDDITRIEFRSSVKTVLNKKSFLLFDLRDSECGADGDGTLVLGRQRSQGPL